VPALNPNLPKLHPIVRAPDLVESFEADVARGLSQPTGEKAIPPKHLYDERGSLLFERICEVDEYYPTRVERAILRDLADEIASAVGPRAILVEPGAGDGSKARILLDSLENPAVFAPFEISEDALRAASEDIAQQFPNVTVRPVCADFTQGLRHLHDLPEDNRVIFFPGSTIGNLDREDRIDLLRTFSRFIGAGGKVLLGADLVKSPDVLLAAYDDPHGVTAAFALNLIDRINRELDAELDPDAFRYVCEWSPANERIEMSLLCVREQRANIAGRNIHLTTGERIHVENSHKFKRERIEREAAEAGLKLERCWTDGRDWFAVCLLTSHNDG